MERESNYDNYGLDPSEEYFIKEKKGMMRIPISLQRNQNYRTIKSIKKKVLTAYLKLVEKIKF